jgi:hypothetical protein
MNTPDMSDEEARIHRAYSKHLNNMMDWSQTITKCNNARDRKRTLSNIVPPMKSLLEQQDQYAKDHLPAKLQEHIEDEIGMLQSKSLIGNSSAVSKNVQFD